MADQRVIAAVKEALEAAKADTKAGGKRRSRGGMPAARRQSAKLDALEKAAQEATAEAGKAPGEKGSDAAAVAAAHAVAAAKWTGVAVLRMATDATVSALDTALTVLSDGRVATAIGAAVTTMTAAKYLAPTGQQPFQLAALDYDDMSLKTVVTAAASVFVVEFVLHHADTIGNTAAAVASNVTSALAGLMIPTDILAAAAAKLKGGQEEEAVGDVADAAVSAADAAPVPGEAEVVNSPELYRPLLGPNGEPAKAGRRRSTKRRHRRRRPSAPTRKASSRRSRPIGR